MWHSIRWLPNQLITSRGTGVWNSASTFRLQTLNGWQLTFNDMSAGIENLVANEIIVPPGGDPVLASWDRPFFKISNLERLSLDLWPRRTRARSSPAGRSTTPPRSRAFSSASPIGGASRNRAIRPTAARPGRSSPATSPAPARAFMGGTIAASTPQNIIWAPADGNQPYYTLNGGVTWSPITLPGVTSWSGFDWAYYLLTRTVTADRVLANTFYLYDPGSGTGRVRDHQWRAELDRSLLRARTRQLGLQVQRSCRSPAKPATCSSPAASGQWHQSPVYAASIMSTNQGDLDGHPQCSRSHQLWLRRGRAGPKLSHDLHRRLCKQRLWHLAVH